MKPFNLPTKKVGKRSCHSPASCSSGSSPVARRRSKKARMHSGGSASPSLADIDGPVTRGALAKSPRSKERVLVSVQDCATAIADHNIDGNGHCNHGDLVHEVKGIWYCKCEYVAIFKQPHLSKVSADVIETIENDSDDEGSVIYLGSVAADTVIDLVSDDDEGAERPVPDIQSERTPLEVRRPIPRRLVLDAAPQRGRARRRVPRRPNDVDGNRDGAQQAGVQAPGVAGGVAQPAPPPPPQGGSGGRGGDGGNGGSGYSHSNSGGGTAHAGVTVVQNVQLSPPECAGPQIPACETPCCKKLQSEADLENSFQSNTRGCCCPCSSFNSSFGNVSGGSHHGSFNSISNSFNNSYFGDVSGANSHSTVGAGANQSPATSMLQPSPASGPLVVNFLNTSARVYPADGNNFGPILLNGFSLAEGGTSSPEGYLNHRVDHEDMLARFLMEPPYLPSSEELEMMRASFEDGESDCQY